MRHMHANTSNYSTYIYSNYNNNVRLLFDCAPYKHLFFSFIA